MNRLTIRLRLTALYGALFVLLGAAMLGLTYLLLRDALGGQKINSSVIFTGSASDAALKQRLADNTKAIQTLTPEQRRQVEQKMALAERVREDFRQSTLTSLLTRGSAALGLVAVGGVWLGWVVAGRTLRPVQQITATARRVAERNLHERIALGGPRDELRELADTFDEMLERLDRAFDGQRRFVANASHELKTPLAINRTLLEVAMAKPSAPAELRQLGQTLLDVNARHERLIDGLLALARSGQAVGDPVPVDLADVARRAVESARPAAVELRLAADPAPTVGDPLLLERLALNLVQNAVRYNTAAGWVEVTTGTTDQGVRLSVANTGPELSPYEIPSLFEPFRRLDDRVGSARGTGLGLSIVRSVAVAHGGDVTARPRPGGGLVVEVTLPGPKT